jgi:MoaA/NifB/PqqE/SkfB family radical SAM enzyme
MLPLRFLQIEPTTRCNFTCGFCAGRSMPQKDLPLAQFQTLLSAAPHVEHVELQGEGESLLHPQVLDMVAALRARSIKVSLITNGSLLGPDVADKLTALGVEKVSVSMESADPETFQRIRGGKFDKVLSGLKTLLSARRTKELDRPIVGLSITVLKDTQAALPHLLSLYDELGLDGGVTLQPLSLMPEYQKNYPQAMQNQALSQDEVDELWVKFRLDRRLARIKKNKERLAVRGFYDELMASFVPGKRRCPWLDAGLYVNHQGQTTACCMIKDTTRHGLGQLGADPLADILSRRQAMADELARGVLPKACEGCELGRFALMNRFQLVRFALLGSLRTWIKRWKKPSKPVRRLPVLPPSPPMHK